MTTERRIVFRVAWWAWLLVPMLAGRTALADRIERGVVYGPYAIQLGIIGGPTFDVSGQVGFAGGLYVYTYTVDNRAANGSQTVLFLLDEFPNHAGLHDEESASVDPGPGTLVYDDDVGGPLLGLADHNYAWTQAGMTGVPFTAGQRQTFSFEDVHPPDVVDWGMYDPLTPGHSASNVTAGLGELPVPMVPEPASLVLFGLAGSAVLLRRWR